MNCRLLLASIATAVASRVAAQTSAPQQPPAQTIAPPSPALSGMSDAQRKHINDTMAVGSLSLVLSRIALPKANNALLKQFIEFEIAEQETVADILKTLQTNGAPTGSIQAPTDAELMQNLDDTGKASVEKLRVLTYRIRVRSRLYSIRSGGTSEAPGHSGSLSQGP